MNTLLQTLLLVFLITSCGNSTEFKEEAFDPTNGNRGTTNTSNTIGFAEIRDKIMIPHCIQCHSNYDQYEVVSEDSGKIVSQVFRGLMPKNGSPLSEDLQSKLLAWYNTGSPEFTRSIDNENEDGSSTPSDDNNSIVITFKDINEEIMTPYCIQCHTSYGEYDAVFKRKDRVLDSITAGRMPKNGEPLSDELKQLIKDWVAMGAPGTDAQTETPLPSEDPKLEANWDSVYKNILSTKCVACHNPNGQASFIDLSTRQALFEQRKELLNNFEDAKNSYLIEVISDPFEPMPPIWATSFENITEEEKKILIEWIEKGLP